MPGSSSMFRRRLAGVALSLALAGGLVALLRLSAEQGPSDRPNLVLIVVDTLRADMILDPEGSVDTPAIDALAADGIQFTQAYSHAPMTLPSHTALFSSQLPHEAGVVNNGQVLPRDLPLLPDWLGRFGYRTSAVVSIGSLFSAQEDALFDRAFDDYSYALPFVRPAHESWIELEERIGSLETQDPFFLFAHYADPHSPYNAHGRADHAAEVYLDGELIANVTTSTASYLEREIEVSPGGSILLIDSPERSKIYHVSLRHGGETVRLERVSRDKSPTPKVHRYRLPNATEGVLTYGLRLWISDAPDKTEIRARYVKEVEYVDGFVGRVIDELKRNGLYDNSIVVLTSDHGEGLGQHGVVGHSNNLYDELLHVPLIIKPSSKHPHRRGLERRREELSRLVDLTPTFLAMLGLPELPGQTGVALTADIKRVLFAETRAPQAPEDSVCLRDESTKLIYYPEGDRFELYDLRADPGELENVYDERGDEHAEWQELLRAFAARRPGDLGGMDEATMESMRALGYI